MPKLSLSEYADVVRRSGLVEPSQLEKHMAALAGNSAAQAEDLAQKLVEAKLVTNWQNEKLLLGKHSGFILGKYKLLGHISSGGMSSVYLAEHVMMQRRVAVKVLPPARMGDSNFLERFHLECQVMAALDHPNIVRAHDFDVDGKLHYLVMEYIEGPDLEVVVRKEGPLAYERAADYIRQAADGLAHAHSAGLIHRDMKPANLLVDVRGQIKVLDLGVARITGANDSTSLTLAHKQDVVGTADFLAPEQAINSHNVDFRADVYALGCTLYYLLAGHPPFPDGAMAQKLLAHQTQEPAPITSKRPDAPATLVAILQRMMAKKLTRRFQTMTDVSAALGAWLADPSYVLPAIKTAGAEAPAKKPAAQPAAAPAPLVELPAGREQRSEEFPLGDLTTGGAAAAKAQAAAVGTAAPAEGYGVVDLDDEEPHGNTEAFLRSAHNLPTVGVGARETALAPSPPPADDGEDSSQEVVARQNGGGGGEGFWDEVLHSIDEKKPAAQAPAPKPEVKAEPAKAAPPTPARRLDLPKPKPPEPKPEPKNEPVSTKPAGLERPPLKRPEPKPPERPTEKPAKATDKAVADKGASSVKSKKVTFEECPACSSEMLGNSVVCGKCGFNTQTGKVDVPGKTKGPGKTSGVFKRPTMPTIAGNGPEGIQALMRKPIVWAGVAAAVVAAGLIAVLGGMLDPEDEPAPISSNNGQQQQKPLPKEKQPEKLPGEKQPGEKQPGEKQPGEKQPGEKQPGEKQPGEKQPPNPGRTRPLAVESWTEADYCWAAVEGSPDFIPNLTKLIEARKGNDKIEPLLVRLLQPSAVLDLLKQEKIPVPQQPMSLGEKATVLVVNALVNNNTPSSQASLQALLKGEFDLGQTDDLVTGLAIAAMLNAPTPERIKLVADLATKSATFRKTPTAADTLKRKVLEFLPTNPNAALRAELSARVGAGGAPPDVVQAVNTLISKSEADNVAAQVEMFLGTAKLDPARELEYLANFVQFGVPAADTVLGGGVPPSSVGASPPATLTLDQARAVCQALWRPEMAGATWDRFNKIANPQAKQKELRLLLKAGASVANNASRERMLAYMSEFGVKEDPGQMVEGSAPFGSDWADPAMWHAVRQMDDKNRFPPSRTGRIELKHRWFEASRVYLKSLNQRCERAAQARPANPAAAAKRPITLPEGAKVVGELRVEWPADAVPNAGPMILHYIRTEERARLDDRDRDHYANEVKKDGEGKLPKRRYLLNATGIEEARWLEPPFRTDDKMRHSLDVLITRVRPDGVPDNIEDLIVETLLIEVPR